jgi:broad specificity phosphatase PhoE
MGQLDSPLTPLGLLQAERLAARMTRLQIDGIYSSDLPRAARTASVIAERTGHQVIFDARLRERNMGIFQGLTAAEMDARFPEERSAYRSVGFEYVIPGGESARERIIRTLACLDELALKHPGQRLLVVTHGGILMGFFEHVFGLPFRSGWKFLRPNAAINVFARESRGWVLETWGDVSHLDGLRAQKN